MSYSQRVDAAKKKEAAEEKFRKSKKYEAEKAAREAKDQQLVQLAVALSEANRSFQKEDLSPEAYGKMKSAGCKAGICGSCRYQSGCLRCDEFKAFRYWKKKEEPAWLEARKKEFDSGVSVDQIVVRLAKAASGQGL